MRYGVVQSSNKQKSVAYARERIATPEPVLPLAIGRYRARIANGNRATKKLALGEEAAVGGDAAADGQDEAVGEDAHEAE